MFEQQSYDNESRQVESLDGDLFRNYEIKNWEYSPVLYKILAISAILNLSVLAFIGQTNLLTLRGCESPFVGRVCQVLDMAYVGAMMFGTDREFVDEAYENIDLGDAEITFIDVSGETPPLSYPAGYFQIANPVQYAMLQQQAMNVTDPGMQMPGFPMGSPSGTESELLKLRPQPPAANPNAFQDDGASLFKKDNASAKPPTRKSPRNRPKANTADDPKKDPETDANSIAEATPDPNKTPPAVKPSDVVAGVDINKRPVVDLGIFVNGLLEKKEVDLQTQFSINAKGKLDKDGRLDPKTFKYVDATSPDAEMVEVVKRAIEAINVAGYLQYLKDISGKDFNLLLQQDAENISAVVQSEMESPYRANSIKSGLDLAISVWKAKKTGENASQNDKDDLLLLENAKVETNGKNVIIKFTVPKAIAHPMINRKLAEQAAELKKPSGTALTNNNDNSTR